MKPPYKYLDYFTEEDGDIFFGREKEVDILMSDIVVSRLVVLFAKTGTGKTSLLRAGVSPQLRNLGYRTIYTQVKEDPYESLGQALDEQGIPRVKEDSLPAQMDLASRHLNGQPIVIFFDQFEEFFFDFERHHPAEADQFIKDIAEVSLGRKQRVHVIFSLREDFYYGMNSFRSRIPAIFHNDSNLHLLPFTDQQARRAITGPAKREGSGFSIEDVLVDQLVTDLAGLSEGELIEPAQLQIICDTLWQQRSMQDRLSLADYNNLQGTKGILANRIRNDLGSDLTNGELDQFERLIDFLSDRKREVKRPRQFSEVVEFLKQDSGQVEELVRKLKKVGILRERTLENVRYVEWITDYVAKNFQDLEDAVRAISTRKKHQAFVEHFLLAGTSQDLDEATRLASQLPAEFEEINANAHLLTLTREEAEFMLLRSLEYDLDTRSWFEIGENCGLDTWDVLQKRIYNENPSIEDSLQAAHAVKLLGLLYEEPARRQRAMELLRLAINNRSLAAEAINVLGALDTPEAVDELQQAALQDELVGRVINSLAVNEASVQLLSEIMQNELGKGSLRALEAAGRLYQISLGRPGRARNRAQTIFQETVREHGLEYFNLALTHCFEIPFWFDQATQSGADVWKVLKEGILQTEDTQKAANGIMMLGDQANAQAVDLLEEIIARQDLAEEIKKALEHIKENKGLDLETSDRVVKLLKSLGTATREAVEKETRPSFEGYSNRSERENYQTIFESLAFALTQGRFLPYLGPGMAPVESPRLSQIAHEWALKYKYPFADSNNLARVAGYISIQQSRKFVVDLLVEAIEKWSLDPSSTYSNPYQLLAQFPVPIYLTTEYHELMEAALRSEGKRPASTSIQWRENGREGESIEHDSYYPTVSEPMVYHLYGQISKPETILVTEDDFLDFVVRTSRDRWLIPTMIRKSLVTSSVAYLGLDLADTSFQTLNRQNNTNLRYPHIISLLMNRETSYDEGGGLRYIEHYLKVREVNVYWGTASEFLQELSSSLRSNEGKRHA